MEPQVSCPRCGEPVDGPLGLCAPCLFGAALEPPELEDYELLGELGRGGMGVVHKARQGSRLVALKMIRSAELATAAERTRFQVEIEAASQLDHPNIVPIFHVGQAGTHPYFTMKLLEGGSLDAHLAELKDPRRCAALVAAVARGVHHAHERGILHRDLKPANVLLDGQGVPYVADFGLARVLDGRATLTQSGLPGTPSYMAPEQASGDPRRVTKAVDVYALGAILYELLTGAPPFEGHSPHDILARLQTEDPAPPRSRAPGVPRDLETICLHCLEKEPQHRYATAAELAEDLEKFARGEPVSVQPPSVAGRLVRWVRRHPLAATAVSGGALVLLGIAAAAVTVAFAQEEELRRDVLRMNVYSARAWAGAVLFQLERRGERLEACISADVARALAEAQDSVAPLQERILPGLERCVRGSAFDSIGVQDARGLARARWPHPDWRGAEPGYFEKNFGWRDYFRGARALAEQRKPGVYVSRAFRSETEQHLKFGISLPILGPDGAWVGVVFATIGSDAVLGDLRFRDSGDDRRTGALVGPRDVERAQAGQTPPETDVMLIHEGLQHGVEMALASPHVAALQALVAQDRELDQFRLTPPDWVRESDAHLDPLPGFEGRWLAGFAPVGYTGYVVVVQTRAEVGRSLRNRLAGWGGGTLGGALLVLAAGLWLARRVEAARAARR